MKKLGKFSDIHIAVNKAKNTYELTKYTDILENIQLRTTYPIQSWFFN
jgi:hypothetical protein